MIRSIDRAWDGLAGQVCRRVSSLPVIFPSQKNPVYLVVGIASLRVCGVLVVLAFSKSGSVKAKTHRCQIPSSFFTRAGGQRSCYVRTRTLTS